MEWTSGPTFKKCSQNLQLRPEYLHDNLFGKFFKIDPHFGQKTLLFKKVVLFIFVKLGCWPRPRGLIITSKLGFQVQTAILQREFRQPTIKIDSGLEAGQRSKGWLLLPHYSASTVWQFETNFYQNLQVSVLLCTLKSDYENTAPGGGGGVHNLFLGM